MKEIERANVCPGDIALIRNREMIPADVMLLASSSERGSACIETSSIDGDRINITEAMAALRHKSVAAHKHYNKTSGISETNR